MKRLSLSLVLIAIAGLAGCKREGDGDLAQRVTKLESEVQRLQEVETFIRPFMEAQQKEAAEQAAREPDPDAMFAVDISGNEFHGPAGAAVTIVEAFDFA